ncbi:MAG: hypothetical protein VB876_12270 [Pirellulales bacterium]
MSISLTCPRCKTPLNLPDSTAGQYAFCEKCEGRLWVPKDAAKSESAGQSSAGGESTAKQQAAAAGHETAAATATQAAPGPTTAAKEPSPPAVDPMAPVAGQTSASQPAASGKPPPPPSGQVVQPSASAPPKEQIAKTGESRSPVQATPPRPSQQAAQAPPGQPSQSAPEPAMRPSRRVATFITADVAQSPLAPAEDGQLPALQLEEADKKTKKPPSTSTMQWRMVLLICGSLSLAAFQLLDFGTGIRKTKTPADDAREELYVRYIGEEGDELKTYQLYLREALVSHDAGDFKRERLYYRKVLHLLRDEHNDRDKNGVTGIRKAPDRGGLPSDERLEDLLSIILKSR